MATYGDEEMLMLSGIQHYAFCPRQWALIHIEQQWHENHLTIEGAYFHERVDDPLQTNLLRGCVVLRSVPLKSSRLGLYGVSDVVALYPASESENAVAHPRYPGNWAPRPVEYKKGKPKEDDIDRVQLCAQAMALEEMWNVSIGNGWLYYGATRHRHEVVFDRALRARVDDLCRSMHALFERKQTPPAVCKPRCKGCSLRDICLPDAMAAPRDVNDYLNEQMIDA